MNALLSKLVADGKITPKAAAIAETRVIQAKLKGHSTLPEILGELHYKSLPGKNQDLTQIQPAKFYPELSLFDRLIEKNQRYEKGGKL